MIDNFNATTTAMFNFKMYCSEKNKLCEFANEVGKCKITACVRSYSDELPIAIADLNLKR